MEGLPNKGEQPISPEAIKIPIEIHYSVDREVSRIRWTADRYALYKQEGYKLTLPKEIKDSLENGKDISDDEIRAAVEGLYTKDAFAETAEQLRQTWEKESEAFLGKLKTLGRPLVQGYKIYLTQYGTGGSYHYPDTILVNIAYPDLDPVQDMFHEMVHLAIQDLIEEYSITHWTKERLVDLTMNKFFPDGKRLQRDPENAETVGNIFEQEFPNIEKVISEISAHASN